MARSGKFWYKNEREVMELLGMHQVPGSGNGWVSKEDGENDHVLCQLKSTDASSIRVQKQDIDKLEYHALVSNKLPVFAMQFVMSGQVYILMKPQYVTEVAKYISTGNYTPTDNECIRSHLGASEDHPENAKPKVKSSAGARETYFEARRKKYEKKENSAV